MIKFALSIIFALSVTVLSVSFVEYSNNAQSAFDFDVSYLVSSLVYFVLMLIGSFASERFKYFSSNPASSKKFFHGISYSYLYRSILVSPIVFGAVVTFIGRDANAVMSAVFAFQNGFFWETVFNTRAETATSSSTVGGERSIN